MGNGFEALKDMAVELKAKAQEREAHQQKKEKVQAKVARETQEFLQSMQRTGVKAKEGMRLKSGVKESEIDFARAMKTAGVAPLATSNKVVHAKKLTRPIPAQTLADNAQVLTESLSDELESCEFLESEEGKSFRRDGIGADVPRDLRRGRWAVVGQIDLHGMFVEEAREAVVKFLKNAQATERYCLRIIHGKGNGSPDGQSILREKVRRWLRQRDEVIAYCEAREIDGGAGATIVRLRAARRITEA